MIFPWPICHFPPHAEFGEDRSLLLAERAAALTMTFAAWTNLGKSSGWESHGVGKCEPYIYIIIITINNNNDNNNIYILNNLIYMYIYIYVYK